ncbi:maltotransferase domain-containing protein [Robbsia sp. KACC 23696]|uniref:maltotransferase domain-containing protein n=1 Tax=Robbsia sp. KACC 23696 TaxID=3149231 RepID=UPI00325AD15F
MDSDLRHSGDTAGHSALTGVSAEASHGTATPASPTPLFAPRIYYVQPSLLGPLHGSADVADAGSAIGEDWAQTLARAASMGFDHLLIAPPFLPGGANDCFVTADHHRLCRSLLPGAADQDRAAAESGDGIPRDSAAHAPHGKEPDALDWLAMMSKAARAHGLTLMLDVVIDRIGTDAGLYRDHPGWFHPPGAQHGRIDPRHDPRADLIAHADFGHPDTQSPLVDWWIRQLRRYAESGVAGFRFDGIDGIAPHVWRRLAAGVRETYPTQRFLAWTPGASRDALRDLESAAFDGVFSSVRWWDARADWLADEVQALARIAPPIAFPETPFGPRLLSDLPTLSAPSDTAAVARAYRRAVQIAALTGTGWMMPMGFEFGVDRPLSRTPLNGARADYRDRTPAGGATPRVDLTDTIATVNAYAKPKKAAGAKGRHAAAGGAASHAVAGTGASTVNTDIAGVLRSRSALTPLTGPDASATALLRTDGVDPRRSRDAVIVLVNPDLYRPALADLQRWRDAMPGGFTQYSVLPIAAPTTHDAASPSATTLPEVITLAPAEVRLLHATRPAAVVLTPDLVGKGGTAKGALKSAAKPVRPSAAERKATIDVIQMPRIAIEDVTPSVDDGRFAAKRVVGEPVTIEADVFIDGHDHLAAAVLWREADWASRTDTLNAQTLANEGWREIPMRPSGNDRWQAILPLKRLGAYEFTIEAWRDTFDTLVDHIRKKQAAAQAVDLELQEAALLFSRILHETGSGGATATARTAQAKPGKDAKPVPADSEKASNTDEFKPAKRSTKSSKAADTGAAVAKVAPASLKGSAKPTAKDGTAVATTAATSATSATPSASQALQTIAAAYDAANAATRLDIVLSEKTAAAVRASGHRDFRVRHPRVLTIQAERRAARFASWYELFPRSASGDPHRHGTFIDVIARLPAIRAMGFDVLYFPPIHPIGLANRKGPNNTLTAGPDDVGSPYAIGGAAGGHTAVHPELGTLDDFRTLLHAAREHGLELALDFAIQCSPDHPWLKEHPDWFAWRPDGSLRYAENPPKKYQDIVNPDFYAAAAVPDLWLELRDAVLFWVREGVDIFRVDNPHTKPFPFWEWMIGEVRRRHPQTIFLSEAFTRPKVMNRLAKVGFSQSYTYFTWRDEKRDLSAYLEDLTQTPVREYFRPNFFVNTPDINPRFLQQNGRAGFVIRAALAATLSGVWGVYSGFELCDAAALPNSEEYLDSEKYQIRSWDWEKPGNIIAEIALLNRIRRANPALQTHLNVTFLPSSNPNVLFFEKATPNRDNVLLIAVSMTPWDVQESTVEIPLWRWARGDGDALDAHDLVSGERFQMQGKVQTIRLDPQVLPFAIRRVSAPGWQPPLSAPPDSGGDDSDAGQGGSTPHEGAH